MEDQTEEIRTALENYARAWQSGDRAALVASYHDEFTLYYPGSHALAGQHAGKANALRVLAEVGRLTNRKLVGAPSIMAGPTHGAMRASEEWTRDGRTATLDRVFIYTVRDGLLHECWLFDADQVTVAAFLGAAARPVH